MLDNLGVPPDSLSLRLWVGGVIVGSADGMSRESRLPQAEARSIT
jgi:hypothetical protein